MSTITDLNPFDSAIVGTNGADTIYAWLGNDTVHGGSGNDAIFDNGLLGSGSGGSGDDALFGDDGNDTFYAGDGRNVIDGGAGTDTVDYGFAHVNVVVNLANGMGSGDGSDSLISIENVNGSLHNDAITGDNNPNVLFGDAGSDTLNGGGGNDVLSGGLGNDTLDGGSGINTADYSYVDPVVGHVNVVLGEGSAAGSAHEFGSQASVNGPVPVADGVDTLILISNVVGSAGNDTIVGNSSDNLLTGGHGRDVLTGGAGNDTFVYNAVSDSANSASDVITDFQNGIVNVNIPGTSINTSFFFSADKIDLSGIDANTSAIGNQAFTFLGTNGFDNHAGEVMYQVIQGDTFIRGDVNGDGAADFTINLQHVTQLVAGDFHL